MKTGTLHIGTKETCKNYLNNIDLPYVYILRRPNERAFYVGKGGGGKNKYRVLDHENEARHPNDRRSNAYKLNIIRLILRSNEKIIYEIDSIHDTEEKAYDREAILISYFKRLHEGGSLTNLAPGGGTASDQSPISKEKHSVTLGGIPENNPERATINRFVLSIHPKDAELKSIPIKPLNQHTAKPTQKHPQKRKPTVRQAVALVASAAANGVLMDDACEIPRLLNVEGIAGVIESGVACDILKSDMGKLLEANDPKDEFFQLTKKQVHKAIGLIGLRKCIDLGIVSTDIL